MKDHLIFDTSNAGTIVDSDSVGAFVRASDGTLITHTSFNAGATQALDVNVANPIAVNVELNGIYDGVTNLLPSNVGIIGSSRAAPGLANQTIQFTGAAPSADGVLANIEAQDVNSFNMGWNGTSWDRIHSTSGAMNVNIQNTTVAVTQSTSPWVVSGTVTANQGTSPWVTSASQTGTWTVGLSEDHGYGAVGAATLRTAAQIGNASGAADFGSGATSTQTLRVAMATDSVVTTSDAALANSAVASHTATLAVANTAQAAVAAPIANRKYLFLYNYDNQKIFIGGAGVSAANGFPISPGSYLEMRAGAASPVSFVGTTGKTPEIRTLELS